MILDTTLLQLYIEGIDLHVDLVKNTQGWCSKMTGLSIPSGQDSWIDV